MKKNNKKKIINTAALGVSLLLSSTLLVGNAVSVYASPTISTDEQNAIDAFLATQPVNGDTRTIIPPNRIIQTPISYTFPGVNNYTNAFQKYAAITHLTKDAVYYISYSEEHAYKHVKIKDWNTVEFYGLYPAEVHYKDPLYGVSRPHEMYFAKELTLIDQNDGTEFKAYNVSIPADDRIYITNPNNFMYTDIFNIDFPIEEEDPRFQIEVVSFFDAIMHKGGYWNLTSTISGKIAYDTIIEIDELLKTNEVVIDDEGVLGDKKVSFSASIGRRDASYNASTYKQYTSDVLYNDLTTIFNSSDRPTGRTQFVYGTADIRWSDYTEPQNRIIRVGIDYTHYVTEDGTVLKPTTYGLNPVDTIAGYQFVSSHREANGDLVHVYTVPTTPTPSTPATPSIPSTPTTVSASPRTMDKSNLFVSAVMFMVGVFTSVGMFFTRNKRS